MTVTIREIAKQAGVSRGTVDRVLNDRPGVKQEVRDRILSIANELNYVPNIAAKALAYQKKPFVFGIVMPPKEIQFFEAIRSGISSAAEELKDLGVRLEYRFVDNQKPEEGAAAIRELVDEGVSGIMYSFMDDELVRESIDFAAGRNVPVVTFNSDVEGCKRICFIGQDLHKSGLVAAGLMNRVLQADAKVLIVTGSLKFHAHRSRVEGFKQGLAEHGNRLLVQQVIEGYDRYVDTFTLLDRALTEHADAIDGIYVATGDIGACVDVIKKHKKEGALRVVCNDLMPAAEQGLKERIIDFTIVQNPERQGYLSLRILFDHVFAGKQPEMEHHYTETHIYIPESL
ncbi:substrate-binding domain-containing protein [Paenibacillus montanisoli]|uniref:HTH lacI-type domain-containing protein n=1 Tax=Paenibacillus montanisoli TaxID=2081970 RepID=A0A328TZY0_9BACL|nr:substrate-binding domain-containing protein [Paenibacillus montanisoli]RAP75999.1 hypothetical protein DL346_11275 [Paenibacillus montanisoli]